MPPPQHYKSSECTQSEKQCYQHSILYFFGALRYFPYGLLLPSSISRQYFLKTEVMNLILWSLHQFLRDKIEGVGAEAGQLWFLFALRFLFAKPFYLWVQWMLCCLFLLLSSMLCPGVCLHYSTIFFHLFPRLQDFQYPDLFNWAFPSKPYSQGWYKYEAVGE